MSHASRSSHIPVAVGNGRRNGIRTRSATSARMARHAMRAPDGEADREQQAVDERQPRRPLEDGVELARLAERPDRPQQRQRQRERQQRQQDREAAPGHGEGRPGTRYAAASRSRVLDGRRARAQDHRQRPLAGRRVGRDVAQVVDDEDRRRQGARPGSPPRRTAARAGRPAGTRSRRRRRARRRRRRRPRRARDSRTATGRRCRRARRRSRARRARAGPARRRRVSHSPTTPGQADRQRDGDLELALA